MIFIEHLLPVGLAPLVAPAQELVCIVLDRFLLRHADIALEHLIRHEGRIRLEGINLRNVPLDEDLEVAHVHERQRVTDDPREEAFILLITTQLRPSIRRAGDNHFFEGKVGSAKGILLAGLERLDITIYLLF